MEAAGIEDTSNSTKARRSSAEVDLTRMSGLVPKLLSGLLICTYESAVAPSDAVSAVAVGVLSVLSARKRPNTAADTNASATNIDGRSARPHVSLMRGRIRLANCVMFARICGNQPTLCCLLYAALSVSYCRMQIRPRTASSGHLRALYTYKAVRPRTIAVLVQLGGVLRTKKTAGGYSRSPGGTTLRLSLAMRCPVG